MVSLQYKGRIHKAKFTARSLRYMLSDQAARLIPALQRRWLLPIEGRPIADAAVEDVSLSSNLVEAPLPTVHTRLGIKHQRPLQLTDHIYTLEDTIVTGWAGAMIKDGLLLTIRPHHNWVSSLRAHPHVLRTLPATRSYCNLMAPIPARGHMFHWLFNSILPFVAFLESGLAGGDLGLIVNAKRTELQDRTLAYLAARYGIRAIESLGQHEAVRVPRLKAGVPVPYTPRALQSPLGLAKLDDIGDFLSDGATQEPMPKRIYVSRNDARLRRVTNEDSIQPILNSLGYYRVLLARMPLAQQVALFRGAEAVAAPHGAGLAHISWCRPGTRIIEFFPDPNAPRGRQAKNASSDFWLISVQRGLAHECHFAGPCENRMDGFALPGELLASVLDRNAASTGNDNTNQVIQS